jgi:hypothetical protein
MEIEVSNTEKLLDYPGNVTGTLHYLFSPSPWFIHEPVFFLYHTQQLNCIYQKSFSIGSEPIRKSKLALTP